MASQQLPNADRKALSITPAQFREQKMKQLASEEKYYRKGMITSILVSAIGLPAAALTGSYLVYAIGGIGFLNIFYMFYKQKGTQRELAELKRKHEAAANQSMGK